MALQRATTMVRAWLPAGLLAIFAAVLLGRLVQLQILDHESYSEAARSELDGSTTVYERRGAILDRNGNVLAMTVDTWDVYVNKNIWLIDGAGRAELLASLLDTSGPQILAALEAAPGINVRVAEDVSAETGDLIDAAAIPGVTLDLNFARYYPEGDLAAGLLGLIGADNTGLAGLELTYDDVLRGEPGRAFFERDTAGEPIPFGRFLATEPKPGQDLILTIDRRLQRLAESTLAEAVRDHEAAGGDIILMDPNDGSVLAVATLPSLRFSTLDLSDESQLDLLRIRSVSDLYEPGSVMKAVTAAAAIDQGVITPDTTYVDTGSVTEADVTITNWENNIYGEQTMTGVLQNSINTGSVFIARKLGERLFHRYLDAFGFGRPTNIDLPGEASGIFRTPKDRGYSSVDMLTQSFGQSISVTPFQIMAAYSAIINGGSLVRPHVVQAVVSPEGTYQQLPPDINGHPISEATSATMREMLRAVIEPGFHHPGKPRNYTAGGKSGTANVPIPNGYDDTQIASFIGFSPADNPQILVLVKLDRNQDFLTGTQAAAPIFADLVDEALLYLAVEPDDVRYAGAR